MIEKRDMRRNVELLEWMRSASAETIRKSAVDAVKFQLFMIPEEKRRRVLILQLLEVRAQKGNLKRLLALRSHPQLEPYTDLIRVLTDHDLDYLERSQAVLKRFGCT